MENNNLQRCDGLGFAHGFTNDPDQFRGVKVVRDTLADLLGLPECLISTGHLLAYFKGGKDGAAHRRAFDAGTM